MEKILVVDDIKRNLDAMSHVLSRSDWQVFTAGSGNEALAWLMENEDVSLILLDVQMPGINGFNLAQLIRQNNRLSNVPIMFISAVNESKEYITRGFSVGASDYLVKPIDNDILIQRINLFLKIYKNHRKIIKDERKALETARIAQKENEAKSRFLANMSHEIRTPLHAILSMSDILKKQALPEDAINKISRIQVAGQGLLDIINDILDFAKVEANQITLSMQDFRLSDITGNLSTIMGNITDKRLDLSITLPEQPLDGYLVGDAFRIGQIMTNLVGNAIKFTPDNGRVEVKIEPLDVTPQYACMRFSVSDNGIGISQEDQKNLFQPFTQADDSISRQYGGTGLGLSIARQFVELHGGTLHLESHPGKGSSFWFDLRLPRKNIEHQWNIKGVTQALVIDDDLFSLKALTSICRHLGMETHAFSKHRELLDFLQSNPRFSGPNTLLLCDWSMPEVDGLTLIKEIKDLLPEKDRPKMVLISGFDASNLPAEDLAEVDAFLNKPVESKHLLKLMERLNNSNHPVSEQEALQAPHEGSLSGMRILVVDDSEINREIAVESFTMEGAVIYTASNGQEALDWLKNNHSQIDLVLMDIQMPVMNGLEATQSIRQTPELAYLPVIAMTANAMSDQRNEAMQMGFNDYITKPFYPEDVAQQLRAFTAGHSHI